MNRTAVIKDLIRLYNYGTENDTQEWLIVAEFDGVDDETFQETIKCIGRRKKKGVLLPSEVADALAQVRAERAKRAALEKAKRHEEQLTLCRNKPPSLCLKCLKRLEPVRQRLGGTVYNCETHGYWFLNEETPRWEFCDVQEMHENIERIRALFTAPQFREKHITAQNLAEADGHWSRTIHEQAAAILAGEASSAVRPPKTLKMG
jgi:hypothetical protein